MVRCIVCGEEITKGRIRKDRKLCNRCKLNDYYKPNKGIGDMQEDV